jgi:biofilm PGA synthesis lipoprotein PgaB
MKFSMFAMTGLLLWAGCAQSAEHATIVLYHHISETTPPSTSVPPARFREHLDHLRDNGFHVMALPELLTALQTRQQVPDKTVAITFDDGYISIYDTAFPMLQEYGFPFSVFINTQPHDDNQSGYMSWAQIREMSDAGVTIANHMENHPHMVDALPGEDQAARTARVCGRSSCGRRSGSRPRRARITNSWPILTANMTCPTRP